MLFYSGRFSAYTAAMRKFLLALLLLPGALLASLPTATADRPFSTGSLLDTPIPIAVRGLVLGQPSVTFLVTIDEHGQLVEHMPVAATHYKLLENAERTLLHASFQPAIQAGQPVSSTGQITVPLYDPAQRAYFSGISNLPPPNTASDLVERRLLQIDKQQFAFRSSKPAELDYPPEVTSTHVMLYTDAAGKPASGRCVLEYWIDPQGAARFPRIVQSDNDAVSTSALLTLRNTHFTVPTRDRLPTYVQVRQPMEFNTENTASLGERAH